ncbi:hypothetical protein BpHYR1_011427 [Brachionus plicatilis]|uniref:Uncharacterized protein n=1 Tax=Brachionus plicatilis TaxID=10195 RepID=A0A3M7RFG0_BRAPC|nr:hypothetical protein BpHYR1_011427 [Brachionus plicatilis]
MSKFSKNLVISVGIYTNLASEVYQNGFELISKLLQHNRTQNNVENNIATARLACGGGLQGEYSDYIFIPNLLLYSYIICLPYNFYEVFACFFVIQSPYS